MKTFFNSLFSLILLLSVNFLSAQVPPYFTDYIDNVCSECTTDSSLIINNSEGCGNQSPLYNSNSFFMINQSSIPKIVRLNFIFVQRDDGSGNFDLNNPVHMQMIDDIIERMNDKMTNMAIANCGGLNSDSKIRYQVNKIAVQDTYLWNNDNDLNFCKCPSRTSWYLRNKAVEIDNDPTIPKGIDVFFTCGQTAYNSNVVNNNPNYQGVSVACSMFPSSNYSDGSYVHMPDCFVKYYWMEHFATTQYNQPWIPTVYEWFVSGTAGTLVHELGHSLGLNHNYECVEYNIMNPSGTSCYHKYLTDNQLYISHRNLSITNIRKFVVDEPLIDEPLVITGDVLIDFNNRIYRSIIIENNARLVISCDMQFASSGSIIVKPGGKLIVNNCKLYSCADNFWQGIEVWGNKTAHQYPDANGNYQQGYVELNNATIENAVCAVDLWKPNNYDKTGGILKASNSLFINNQRAFHAMFYNNHLPNNSSIITDNVSRFDYCSFQITSNYNPSYLFFKHADLFKVRGIKFNACNFSTVQTPGVSTWNQAIASYSAGFKVNSVCNASVLPCSDENYDRSTFTGFQWGVYAFGDLINTNTFSISRATFNNNGTGLWMTQIKNAAIYKSEFNLGPNLGDAEQCGTNASGFGIHADNSSGFSIEENSFQKATGTPSGNYTGIYIGNTNASDEVYKNDFTGISYGNIAEGKNWINNIWTGLAYYCNNNSGNWEDFRVSSLPGSGIQARQGDVDHAAGNTFTTNAHNNFNNLGEPRGGIFLR